MFGEHNNHSNALKGKVQQHRALVLEGGPGRTIYQTIQMEHFMSNPTKNFFRNSVAFISSVSLFLVLAGGCLAAGPFGLPWRAKLADGSIIGATMPFTNQVFTTDCLLYDSTEACSANHKDPTTNNYSHAHSGEMFGLFYVTNGSWNFTGGEVITANMSDLAWTATSYPTNDYTLASGSTFLANCYSYAAGSPTPMTDSGWRSWTDGSSQCENANKIKSYKVGIQDHVIQIDSLDIPAEGPCKISGTSEKNASSGVYYRYYTNGIDAAGDVRKRKL